MNFTSVEPLQKIRNRIKKKVYWIDPEPLLDIWRVIILLPSVFMLSNLLLLGMSLFINMHISSAIVEITVYVLPLILIAVLRDYPIGDIIRIRNFLRIDRNLIAIFSALFAAILAAGLLGFVRELIPFNAEQLELFREMLAPPNLPFSMVFITVALIPGICEEIFFRGVIQPALIKRFGPIPGILITAFFFGLFHVQIQQMIVFFCVGLYFGLLAYRAGTFLYSALAHTIFNGIAVVAAALNRSEGVTVQNGGVSAILIYSILVVFIFLILLLYRITPRRVIGKPDMYYI
jgi:membrane protease YdiL (CAAX protease family)